MAKTYQLGPVRRAANVMVTAMSGVVWGPDRATC